MISGFLIIFLWGESTESKYKKYYTSSLLEIFYRYFACVIEIPLEERFEIRGKGT